MKLCSNVHSISLSVFIVVAYLLCLLWHFHRLITGKMKIGYNCCLNAGILTESFWKCVLSSRNHLIRKHMGDEAETLQ